MTDRLQLQQNVAAHYTRLIARWPVDKLRPENLHFQRLLQARLKSANDGSSGEAADLSKQANAAYLLLDNTISSRFPLSNKIMKPDSRPTLYEELDRELEEGPQRRFFAHIWKRLTATIRRQ